MTYRSLRALSMLWRGSVGERIESKPLPKRNRRHLNHVSSSAIWSSVRLLPENFAATAKELNLKPGGYYYLIPKTPAAGAVGRSKKYVSNKPQERVFVKVAQGNKVTHYLFHAPSVEALECYTDRQLLLDYTVKSAGA